VKEGSLVKITGDVRPKYLQGLLVEVTQVNRTTISGDIANPDLLPGRRYSGGIRIPFDSLELELA
jgi:hypothetical protein